MKLPDDISDVDRDLFKFFGCEESMADLRKDGEECDESDAVVQYGEDGHDGPGYYIWCGEYPEEGSERIESFGTVVRADVEALPVTVPPKPVPTPTEPK